MTYGDRRMLARSVHFCVASAFLNACALTASSATGTTLTVATHYTNEQRAPLTACFHEYEQLNPGITIIHRQLSYRDFLQTLFMARIGGTAPDIYNLSTVWTTQLVKSGSLSMPPADVSSFVQHAYLAGTPEAMTTAGHVWGIPSEVNVYLLVYNKLLFARAGIERPPISWDELVDDAVKISKTNRQGRLITTGFGFGPSPAQAVGPFLSLLYSHGEPLLSSDELSTNLTSESARAVLVGQVHLFSRQATSIGSSPTQFPSGTLGMMIVPNWYKKDLQQGLGDRFAATVGVAPIPGGPNWRTVQYGFYWAVDANSRHTAEAWKLLKWMNSPRASGSRSCVGNMLLGLGALTGNQADLAASAQEVGDPFMKPFADALAQGRALPEPSVPHANEIEELLRSYIEEAWLGLIPASRALHDMDAAIRMILRESD